MSTIDFKGAVKKLCPAAIATGCYSMHSPRQDRYVIYDNATGKNLSREKRTIGEAWIDAYDLLSVSGREMKEEQP